MERKRLSSTTKSSPTRKRLTKHAVAEVPDRPPPTLLKLGPKCEFKPWEIRKLRTENALIDRVFDSAWLAVFSGPGYIDFSNCATYAGAQSFAGMFTLRYPRMKVEWLKGGPDVTPDNAVRGGQANGSDTGTRTRAIKRKVHERLQKRQQRLSGATATTNSDRKAKRQRNKS